ncbi:MAG: hypothetical protein ABI577_12960 [bacterium]
MTEITQEAIMAAVSTAKPFALVILKKGPNYESTGNLQIEHLKHIFTMRSEGQQLVTLPVTDSGEIAGIGLMATSKEEAIALTAADPGVIAGRFTFEVMSCMGMPGDSVR